MLMTDFGLASLDYKENQTMDGLNNAPFVFVLDTSGMYNSIAYRHSGRTNVLFADGHVSSCAYGDDDDKWPKGTKGKNGGLLK